MSKKNWQQVKDDFEKEQVEEELQEIDDDLMDEEEEESSSFSTFSREKLENELIQTKKEAQENLEKAVRAVAEMDNIRKRAERDVVQARLYSQEKLIQALLPVLDSLEQALATINQETHGELGEGVALTLRLMLSTLEKHGVVEINPEGLPFNPQEHEAMSTQVSDEVPANTILVVFQKGYKLNDRVIRPARVIVSKAVG